MVKISSKSTDFVQLVILLGIFSFLVIYLTFGLNFSHFQQFRVQVPECDADLPGPKTPQGFLVYGNYCQIPDIDPYTKDVMKLLKKKSSEPCFDYLPLTTIEQNFEKDSVRIIFHPNVVSSYLSGGVSFDACFYQEVFRAGTGNDSDFQYKLSQPQYFEAFVDLPATAEFILVECKTDLRFGQNVTYSNAHPLIRRREEIQKTFEEFKAPNPQERPLSVLVVGLDSISRMNLLRTMPKTAQHLYNSGWFDLQGYTKIADNTFPNLMAILTGFNTSLTKMKCDPSNGHLNECPFIWDQFKNSGYVTAYGEDEQSLSTFNYNKLGFKEQPTDYYLRPWGLAAEKKLKIQLKSALSYCLGFLHYAEYIFEYAIDFAATYKTNPFFGLFWINTFSHNELSDPFAMDARTKVFLKDLQDRGVLENSMVVFLSDHGMRFGPVRLLETGWHEERMPFIFIWLPEWFKQKHPEIVLNLKINRNRLTNPYDLHMTFKHILELSGRAETFPAAESCSHCQSIFKEIPHNRSCEQISIDPHWCTCSSYEVIDVNSNSVKNAAEETIEYVNNALYQNALDPITFEGLCATLKLKTIISAKISTTYKELKMYVLTIQVAPSDGIFEATVGFNSDRNMFEVLGTISRLNKYGNQSSCISEPNLKLYCYCKQFE